MIVGGVANELLACPGCYSGAGGHRSNPTRIRTLPHQFVPPGFPYNWNINHVRKIFEDHKLVPAYNEVNDLDFQNLPARARVGMKFSVPSAGQNSEGCILSFDSKDDINIVLEYFLDKNQKGELYTWSFSKDNILLLITGTISEADARQYESALYDLDK